MVPAPASTVRNRQPVDEVAKAIAAKLKVRVFKNIVVKKAPEGSSVSLKDMKSKVEKQEALAARFVLNDGITNQGKWNVLVVDDLYDSGATLEAICAILASYDKVDNIYVAALTWK